MKEKAQGALFARHSETAVRQAKNLLFSQLTWRIDVANLDKMTKKLTEEERCFVKLADGKRREFPTATAVKDIEGGGIEIWNEHIHLASFSKGEFLSYWINPHFLIARNRRPAQRTKAVKKYH